MRRSHRVAQVSKPGMLEIAERETPSPGPGEVLISVEACGICGADVGGIDRTDPEMRPARVPGHESRRPHCGPRHRNALDLEDRSEGRHWTARWPLYRMRSVPPRRVSALHEPGVRRIDM
jgi:hypothetical protein